MATRAPYVRRSTRLVAQRLDQRLGLSSVPVEASAGKEPVKRPRQRREVIEGHLPEELQKSVPTRDMEEALWAQGVDEAGRGPLAEADVSDITIKDSKDMPAAAREAAYAQLTKHPLIRCAWCIVDVAKIDRINILQATMLAMEGAVKELAGPPPDYVLVDGNRLPEATSSEAIIKGDGICRVIAAASIIAKVTRDKIMDEYDRMYPQYGFVRHKGYGTKEHRDAIQKHGPCPIHRLSFEPVKSMKIT